MDLSLDARRNQASWDWLATITIDRALTGFLETTEGNTQRSYRIALRSAFKIFAEIGIFQPTCSLQAFSLCNINYLLDVIKCKIQGSEATKQARAAAFISFTRYLYRMSGGLIHQASPQCGAGNATFKKIRRTSKTQALTREQWQMFATALKNISLRDYLIACATLQGAKRIGEVLDAKIDQISFQKRQIVFDQYKSTYLEVDTTITYPDSFMQELRTYIGDRKDGFIFVTKRGKPISQPHVYRVFARASHGIGLRVHPHVLRVTAITFLSAYGASAKEIMQISGHADEKRILYYDKTPGDPSRFFQLI